MDRQDIYEKIDEIVSDAYYGDGMEKPLKAVADWHLEQIAQAKKDAVIETLNTILSAFKSNDLAYGKLPCEYIEKLLKQAQDK